MRNNTLLRGIAAAVVLVSILTGCSLAATPTPVTPTVNPQPTFDAIQTQAVATAVAGMTLNAPTATPVTPTATLAPTNTPAPTDTPLPPTETATPTRVFIPWTKTPTAAPLAYNCTVTAVKHLVGTSSVNSVAVNTVFDTVWSLKNSGTQTWDHSNLDIVYSSGDKLQTKGDLYDMPHDVAPNGTLDVTVDMKSPANDGTYTTAWAIHFPDGTDCTLSTSINVTK